MAGKALVSLFFHLVAFEHETVFSEFRALTFRTFHMRNVYTFVYISGFALC